MTDNDIINVCKNSESMIIAAKNLGMTYTEFKAKAMQLGCYDPNKGHSHKTTKSSMEKLQEILDGKHPTYQPFKLKNLLLKHGLKENKCEICGISEWNGKPLNCQLHHKDGNKYNQSLDNLIIICPNCHSQTETFGFKKGKKYNLN